MTELQAPYWGRQPAENEQDWALWSAFLELRSHAAVVARARIESATVRAAALRWRWTDRAQAYDRVVTDAIVAERVSLARTRLAVSSVSLTNASGSLARLLALEADKLHATSESTVASTLSARDVSLVHRAVREQHALDLEVVDSQARELERDGETDGLTDEQLLAIEEIIRPARGVPGPKA